MKQEVGLCAYVRGPFRIQARRAVSGGFRTKCVKKKVEWCWEKLQEVSTPSEPLTRRLLCLPDPIWVPVEDLCEGLRFQPRLCYLSIYLAAGVKWLSDKLECNDNDRDS